MDKDPLKIVGIGTFAGGLTALEDFFTHIPSTSNIAFVVVQHLDPNHTCMMSELLQRVTTVPVSQIENRTLIKPKHIYIIPPNKALFILKGRLNLKAQTKSLGLTLVQAPKTAKFDSMPLNAINTQSTNIVASAKELGQNIVAFSKAPRTSPNNTLPSLSSTTLLAEIYFACHCR